MEHIENIDIIRPNCQNTNLFQNVNIEIKSQIIDGQYPVENIEELDSLVKIALLYYLILLNKYDEFKNIIESYDIDLNDGDYMLIKYCCHNSKYNYIKLLLENGVNINVCDDIIIKLVIWPKVDDKGRYEFIKYLIDNGANIHCDNYYPLRILVTFETYRLCEMVDLLLDNGADIKVNNNYCLCTIVKKGNYYLIQKFIDRGADINCREGYPLRKAVFDCNYYATNILLKNGADINYLSSFYLKKLIINNKYDLIELLINYGVNFSILNEKNIDTKTVDLLLETGVDYNTILNILLNSKYL
ncbi:ankyrin repeat protein [Megavirus baoshan]|uniref:Ankyrin repeat protein n=1 Tax=Megavirus baoshan TaxID=2496520 RepID=A0A3S8UY95_9VIRU|nr:ankyrin repeat protein [Megavirus baoshan]AZL89796.1 ankyrin repeat protein [Megavirus baoshan]